MAYFAIVQQAEFQFGQYCSLEGMDITANLESLRGVQLGIDQRIWLACQECLHWRLVKQLIALLTDMWSDIVLLEEKFASNSMRDRSEIWVKDVTRTTLACKCAPNNNKVCILRSMQSKQTITLQCYTTLRVTFFFSMSIVIV